MTTQISSGEISPQVLIGMVTRHVDGKSTFTVLGASAHGKIRVLRAFAQLAEVPDATATTYTIKLQNGGTDMTDTLTFTQGTDTVGKTKDFTLTANQDVILSASALTVIAAGTTATAGEIIVYIQYENTN